MYVEQSHLAWQKDGRSCSNCSDLKKASGHGSSEDGLEKRAWFHLIFFLPLTISTIGSRYHVALIGVCGVQIVKPLKH